MNEKGNKVFLTDDLVILSSTSSESVSCLGVRAPAPRKTLNGERLFSDGFGCKRKRLIRQHIDFTRNTLPSSRRLPNIARKYGVISNAFLHTNLDHAFWNSSKAEKGLRRWRRLLCNTNRLSLALLLNKTICKGCWCSLLTLTKGLAGDFLTGLYSSSSSSSSLSW